MPFPFKEVIEGLKEFYTSDVPVVTRIANERHDPFLVLIGCLLSLRTKDETTENAMERLMKRARTPRELLSIPTEEVERIIYPVGFYKVKSRLIKEISRTVIEKYHNVVPDTLDELLTIKGVGRKTANIVITEGFGAPGIAVDTHVHRISNRLGAVRTKTPEETEMRLRQILPQEYWRVYNPLLVTHGRRTCTPLSPWCGRCRVHDLCARVGVTRSR
ncbi:MAG: endonuclease III [Syntrophorhabdales bacterium]|jgi:endonuclease-3